MCSLTLFTHSHMQLFVVNLLPVTLLGTGRFDAEGERASFLKILGPSGGHRQVSSEFAVRWDGCGDGPQEA